LLLAAGSFALYAVAPTPETQAGAGDEAAAVPVRVLKLEARLLERSTRLSGVIEPRRRVELFSEHCLRRSPSSGPRRRLRARRAS
jgi:multidrug efflux pump subunit AcrA (membrane-fusion protein)